MWSIFCQHSIAGVARTARLGRVSSTDPVWDELGKVDYFLDHLGRAVERGDLSYDAYAALASPYWGRRNELVATLERRMPASPSPAATEARPLAAEPPLVAPPATAWVEPPPPRAAARPARVREPVSPGTWMAYAGALLVVIAVAIFTIYAWETFPPLAKLGVLLAVTAAFYAGGEFIRTKLALPAVGVALVSVGSAMLLFDGWMVIRSTGATGPLPWALLLLVCSLAYWATELRIAGGWFGAIGAAAQVGWWWLLGQAFGWEDYWVAAGMAGIAVLWVLASERTSDEGPLAPLKAVLSLGSVFLAIATCVAVGVAAVAAQFDAPTMWPIAAAALAAIAFAIVMERLRVGPLSIAGQAPLFLAALAYWAAAGLDGIDPSWLLAATFALMTIAYALRCLWRRSPSYAAAALASELLFWLSLADVLEWSSRFTIGIIAGMGLATIVAARIASTLARDDSRWRGMALASTVWDWGGIGVLALATLLVPVAEPQLLGSASEPGKSALLAAWVLFAWLAAAQVRRSAGLGRVAIAWSFYALASALAWVAPDLHEAWRGVALLALAVLWEQSGPAGESFSRVPRAEIRVWARVAYVLVPLVTFIAASDLRTYAMAALLGAAGLAWLLDALLARYWWACVPASAALAGAAAIAAWTAKGLDEGVAAAASVLALAGVTMLAAARLQDGIFDRSPARRGTGPSATEWSAIGTGTLALAAVLVPLVGGVPLTGSTTAGLTVLVAVWVLAGWLAGAAMSSSAIPGRVAIAWSFFTWAAILSWAWPGWPSAYYGLAMLGLAVPWGQGGALAERLTRVQENEIRIWMRVAYVVIPLLAVQGSALGGDIPSYPVAVLLAAAAVAWLADALRTREWWGLAVASGSLVTAAAVAGWTADGPPAAGIAAAAAALAPALAGLLSPRRKDSWGALGAGGGTLVASLWSLSSLGSADRLATALLLLALAWALTAWCSAVTELGGIAGLAALLSLVSALSWWDAPAWVTVASIAIAAGVLLAPRAAFAAQEERAQRLLLALACVGAVGLAILCALGFGSWTMGASLEPAHWYSLGATGFAVALMLSGGYAIVWTTLESWEPGLYAGAALIVLGAFVQLDGWGIDQAEWYLVLSAAYVAGMGVLWATRKPDRRVPIATDWAAFALAVAIPLWLAVVASDPAVGLTHGLWTLGLSAVSILVGVFSRTRVYFFGGITVLVLDALWLSRSVLFALPSWVWIGTIGLALIVAGATYARRESLEDVGRAMRDRLIDWR